MFNKNEIALMLGLLLIIQNAYGLTYTTSAGTGSEKVSAVSDARLSTVGGVNEATSIAFGDGVTISRSINPQSVSGSGELNESHTATNAAGDYVSVSAHLDDSTSWTYDYDLTTTSSYVSGRENVKVASGTGLDFRGWARSSSGNRVGVEAIGGLGCPVSMTYSNSVRASGNSATASQRIAGASTAGRAQGCTDPLMISGSAYTVEVIVNEEGGPQVEIMPGASSSNVEAGVLGGSRINAATTAISNSGGYSTSQSISASRFDEIWNRGSSGQVVAGIVEASVGVGASNGTNFVSAVTTSFGSDTATASQRASGKGARVYKFSNATGGLYNGAGTNTTVQSGSLITADMATGKWNSSQVTETVAASGEIHRKIYANADLSSGLDREEIGIIVDGRLIGNARESSTPTSLMINGRWLGIASPGTFGGKYFLMQYDDALLVGDYFWEDADILND